MKMREKPVRAGTPYGSVAPCSLTLWYVGPCGLKSYISLDPIRVWISHGLGSIRAWIPHGLGYLTGLDTSRAWIPHGLGYLTGLDTSRAWIPHGLGYPTGLDSVQELRLYGLPKILISRVPAASTTLRASGPYYIESHDALHNLQNGLPHERIARTSCLTAATRAH